MNCMMDQVRIAVFVGMLLAMGVHDEMVGCHGASRF